MNPIIIFNCVISLERSSVGAAPHSPISSYTHTRTRTQPVTEHQPARIAGVRARDPIQYKDCISQQKKQKHHQESNNTATEVPTTTPAPCTAIPELTIYTLNNNRNRSTYNNNSGSRNSSSSNDRATTTATAAPTTTIAGATAAAAAAGTTISNAPTITKAISLISAP